MKIFILTILLLSFNSFALSYGDLAQNKLTEQLNIVDTQLANLEETSTPISTKVLRKSIGKLKIYIDVFIYAYPGKKILTFRDSLDKGYEIIGNFKDLYDAFDENELTSEIVDFRRAKALEWKSSFYKNFNKRDIRQYLLKPIFDKPAKRKKEDLPKFFWSLVKFPKKDILNADLVLRDLLNGMVQTARKRLKKVQEFKDLFDIKDENKYHDFRKLLRSHLKLIDVFFVSSANDQFFNSTKLELEELISHFGDLNDLLTKLHNTKKPSKNLKAKIQNQWIELREFIKREDFVEKLKSFKV